MALVTHVLLSITLVVLLIVSPSATAPYLNYVELDAEQGHCKPDKAVALGVENGRISDSQLTASSVWSADLSTRQCRLNGPYSWSARRNDQNQWIQVDLGRREVVTAIATQGRKNFDQWVKTYSISYSSDGKKFENYKINGIVVEFKGNYDRSVVVRIVLSPAVTARYIRIHPKTWYGHISMRFEIFGCPSGRCKSGEVALGMQNGRIHDSQLTASSFWSAALSPRLGRLNGGPSWSARKNDINQWFQIDLGRKEPVTAIATQGRSNYNQWVKTYSVSYSLDGINFSPYKSGGVKKIFSGNNDRHTIVTHVLSSPVTARFIRIHPLTWYGHISMRMEVYGCYNGPCESGEIALGMQNGNIRGFQLTASSYWDAALSPQKGRLKGVGSWSARRNDLNQWFQIDLGKPEVVTAVATQGRSNYNQWVKEYSVSYSLDGMKFEPYKIGGILEVFLGNSDRHSMVTNELSPTINARYIRIHPKKWFGHISMRLEIYGCYRENRRPCATNEVALGIEKGKIPDSQLTASSYWSAGLSPQKVRLYGVGSWSSRKNDQNQWIQVDLGSQEVVTAIGTQGRSNYNQWVKTYSVSYSLNGINFEPYKSGGVTKVFNGNSDKNSVVKNNLSPIITARYIRIHPKSWNGHISMRIELYGCYRDPCRNKPCKNGGVCTRLEDRYFCRCLPKFGGSNCEHRLWHCKPDEAAALGVETGRISDSQLTASSVWSAALSTPLG